MKIFTKAFLLILILFNSITVFASKSDSCLEKVMTQLDMNKCSGIDLEKVDSELNRVYRLIKKVYKEDKVFLTKLKNAQRAWIKLRDADLDLQFPHVNEPGYYGSVFPMCANNFKTYLTLQRVVFLKRWLAGSEEGDVCMGSLMLDWSIKEALKK